MNKIILAISLTLLTVFQCFSQDSIPNTFRTFQWQKHPKITKLTTTEAKQSFVVLKDDIGNEYFYDAQNNLSMYKFQHKIIRLNDDNAIETFNKIFISMANVQNVITIKARTIKPDGTIINVNDSAIKEADNYQGYGKFKFFAVGGLEKGCEVEYYYLEKMDPTYYGRLFFQDNYDIKNKSFTILSPQNILFKAKSYNGLSQPIDTIYDGIFHLAVSQKNIPAFQKEPYASEDANLMRLDFKYDHNTVNQSAASFTWGSAAERFYNMVYSADKKDMKAVKKFLKPLKLNKIKDEKQKIFTIENYIKNHIDIQGNDATAEDRKIAHLLETHTASYLGIARLYAAVFQSLEIKQQLVLAADRTKLRLDPDFPDWNSLQDYLFYFPDIKTFLQPTSAYYRNGLINPVYRDNNALFIKPVKIGNIQSYIPIIKLIPESNYKDNNNDLNLQLNFNADISKIKVNLFMDYTGYEASFLQPVYDKLSDVDKKSVVQGILKDMAPDADFSKWTVLNHNVDTPSTVKPFIIKSQFSTSSSISYAGNDRLFNIGMLIGSQVEMYDDTNRLYPVEIEHPHEYHRTITFNIPKDYKVIGLKKLNMNITANVDSDSAIDIGFISKYNIKDDSVTVKIHEFYSQVYYKIKDYEKFRKVINAAADFNKITLIFKKK